ncbi:hypothetical protein [uncultured Cocleimonas sp.]|uniref:hypothetical protein n=1 Tax=uncultured Cocleimonas sp. TaxID=1051587 RepID=UPI0026221689|nr:hypothetical protein [uncultured Cocleimonas sp.]
MTYFLFQIALISTVAIITGSLIGWWLHHYYGQNRQQESDKDLTLVKDYLGESIKENARLKLQLKQMEEKLEKLSYEDVPKISGVDFEAYKAFENTVKEANLQKYLN